MIPMASLIVPGGKFVCPVLNKVFDLGQTYNICKQCKFHVDLPVLSEDQEQIVHIFSSFSRCVENEFDYDLDFHHTHEKVCRSLIKTNVKCFRVPYCDYVDGEVIEGRLFFEVWRKGGKTEVYMVFPVEEREQ